MLIANDKKLWICMFVKETKEGIFEFFWKVVVRMYCLKWKIERRKLYVEIKNKSIWKWVRKFKKDFCIVFNKENLFNGCFFNFVYEYIFW